MELLRIQNIWWLTALATHVCSISLLGVLQSYPELSTLASYLNGTSALNTLLTNANNFTFLAANNNAIGKFLAQQYKNTLSEDDLEAITQYSLLKGGFPTLSFSDTPDFAASNLVNATYANVTAGQAAELVLSSSGAHQVITGNKNVSAITTSDIVCTGGIVHIIDEVPSIPITAVAEVPAARLQYFVEILNQGGFLNAANTYVNQVLEIPDVTYFLPNSAQAVSDGQELLRNSSVDLQALFEYHVVTGYVGYSTLLKDGMQLKTAQGKNMTVTVQDGEMFVNAAKVTATDYIVANGVVHVIDNLLNPNNTALPPPPKPANNKPAPTSTSASPAVTSTSTPSSSSHSGGGGGLSTGAKAGIGVGSAIGGILLLLLLIWFCRSRKVDRDSPSWVDVDPMSGVPADLGTTRYGPGGRIIHQRPDSGGVLPFQGANTAGMGMGMGMPGMHGNGNSLQEDYSKGSEPDNSSVSPSQPSVPPRSPDHRVVNPYRF